MHYLSYQGLDATPLKYLIIFFHGFGSNGANLLDLSHHLEKSLPHSVFVAPDAFTPLPGYDAGYQWFDLGDMDPAFMARGADQVRNQGIAMVQAIQQHYGVGPENTILVGFSQGTMMALSLALGHSRLARAVIGFSGGLYMDSAFIKADPEFLKIHLIHGEEDTVVPFEASLDAANMLDDLGFKVELCLIPHLDHGISQEGLREAQTFLETLQ
jgi:phospholipase/carboxylesterase